MIIKTIEKKCFICYTNKAKKENYFGGIDLCSIQLKLKK